jgi:hypothetical protein
MLTDREYEVADKVYLHLEDHRWDWLTPSAIGRGIHEDTAIVRRVLTWLDAHSMVNADGNGARRRYTHRGRVGSASL